VILYRDQDWLAVDKPAGLATHAGHPGELGAVEWLALHLDLEAFVVSRLDAGTSGVLWLALHREASGLAQRLHEEGAALKTYVFLSPVDAREAGLPETWTRDDALDGHAARTAFRLRKATYRGRGLRPEAAAQGWDRLRDVTYEGRGA